MFTEGDVGIGGGGIGFVEARLEAVREWVDEPGRVLMSGIVCECASTFEDRGDEAGVGMEIGENGCRGYRGMKMKCEEVWLRARRVVDKSKASLGR